MVRAGLMYIYPNALIFLRHEGVTHEILYHSQKSSDYETVFELLRILIRNAQRK